MKRRLEELLCADAELDNLEFKQAFDPNALGDWLELIKDIVAIANSGGGCIIIGCLNNGHPIGVPQSLLSALDPAIVDAKVFNYTGAHLRCISTTGHQKEDKTVVLMRIPEAEYPMPFTKVGNYTLPDSNKQKTAFNQGNLYFRHSAKSEAACSDDIRKFVDRKVEQIREFWLSGIRQVVEAPRDSILTVVPAEIRLSSSPDAQVLKMTPELVEKLLKAPMVDHTHPYRQKEVIEAFNKRNGTGFAINSHDLLCVRRAFNIQRDLKYCYNMNWSSPRYSEAFVDWLIESHRNDRDFFSKARAKADELKAKEVSQN